MNNKLSFALAVQIFLRTSLRHLRRKPLRAALTLMGVIMGVSTFIFGPSLGGSINQSLDLAFRQMAGNAALEVRGTDGGFAPELLNTIRSTEGVAVVAPQVMTGGILLGQSEPLLLLGVDPAVEQQARSYTLIQGEFVSEGTLLLSERYAQEKGLQIGQRVTVLAPGGIRLLTIGGTLATDGVGLLNGGDLALLNLPDALHLRGEALLDSAALLLAAGTNRDSVRDALNAALPDGVQAQLPQGVTPEVLALQTILTFLMGAISLMLMGVGASLVYNALSVAVTERRREIGLLRAAGVSATLIQRMFLVEAAAFGLVGSIFGILLGILLTYAARDASIIPDSFASEISTPVQISVQPAMIPVAFVVGIVLPVLAGWFPARAASRVDVLEALMRLKDESHGLVYHRLRLLGAALIVVLGSTVTLLGATLNLNFMIVQSAAVTALIAALMLIPLLFLLLRERFRTIMQRLFGMAGWLAAQNIARRPKRMVATATLLMMSAWTTGQVSSSFFGYSSFQETWNTSENRWDFIIAGAGSDAFRPLLHLPPELPAEIAAENGVQQVISERIDSVQFPAFAYTVRALDSAAYQAAGGSFVQDSSDPVAALTRLQDLTQPAVIVSGFVAVSEGLAVGDQFNIPTPSGTLQAEVAAVVISALEPFKPSEGVIVIDLALYRQHWNDDALSRVLVTLDESADAQSLRREWLTRYAQDGVFVFYAAEIGERVAANITASVNVSYIIGALFFIIILAGLTNMVIVLVLDRSREIGLLRATGLSARLIAWSIVLEVSVLAFLASLCALPLVLITTRANEVSLQRIMGIGLGAPVWQPLLLMAILIVVVAFAAYLPARRVEQMDVLETLRQE